MKLGDIIEIRIRNTTKNGKIVAINDEKIVVGFDGSDDIVTLFVSQRSNEPSQYVFRALDGNGRERLLEN